MVDLDDLIAEAREWPRDGVNEGWLINALADALATVRAERDAAVAAVERVRAVAKDWECDEDAKGLHFDLLAALDGAPEPEWEYGYTDHGMNPMRGCQDFDTARACAQGMQEKVVRRRPAGPWLPVEGESCGD